MLPDSDGSTSYSNFLTNYGVDYNTTKTKPYDVALLNLPLSFLRSGYYSTYGGLYNQVSYGNYRMASFSLLFDSGNLNPTNSTNAYIGYSVRCVSR